MVEIVAIGILGIVHPGTPARVAFEPTGLVLLVLQHQMDLR